MMGVQSRNTELLEALVVVFAITATGCGPSVKVPTAPVSGVVTVNGKPVEGLEVVFVPEAKIRPGIGITDVSGRYEAKFLQAQWGVPLGPCVVRISLYRDDIRMNNLIPPPFNEKAAENPDLRLNITKDGAVFNYDVTMDLVP
jgi:hypothetical protein